MLCVLAFTCPVGATSPARSVSTSRQFLVYGPDLQLRGAICDLAERTKRDLLQLIGQRDEWTTPILIHAQYPQANLPETPRAILNFSQTGDGLKLQLDLTMASEVTQPEIRRELLGAVLLEMMHRRAPGLPAGTTYIPPPDWLLDGLQVWSSTMTDSLAAPVVAHKILPLEEFLGQRPDLLDAPGRSLYCAYAFALVDLLTHSPDGRQRLARFIFDLPSASNNATETLRAHFPELIGATGSSKAAWILHVTRLAARQSYQLLGGGETERILNEMLSLTIPNTGPKRRYQLHEFPAFIRHSSAKPALARLGRDLSALGARANPIYRPMISEYEKVATRLVRGKTHGIAERLARLITLRKGIAAQMQQIDDYMNWFEATKSRGPSRAFADYMKAADLADQPEQRRRDPISVYLDVLETQFQN